MSARSTPGCGSKSKSARVAGVGSDGPQSLPLGVGGDDGAHLADHPGRWSNRSAHARSSDGWASSMVRWSGTVHHQRCAAVIRVLDDADPPGSGPGGCARRVRRATRRSAPGGRGDRPPARGRRSSGTLVELPDPPEHRGWGKIAYLFVCARPRRRVAGTAVGVDRPGARGRFPRLPRPCVTRPGRAASGVVLRPDGDRLPSGNRAGHRLFAGAPSTTGYRWRSTRPATGTARASGSSGRTPGRPLRLTTSWPTGAGPPEVARRRTPRSGRTGCGAGACSPPATGRRTGRPDRLAVIAKVTGDRGDVHPLAWSA